MKVHLMETHHEVYQDDHEWLDLLVDDDQNKLHFQVIKNSRKKYTWSLLKFFPRKMNFGK